MFCGKSATQKSVRCAPHIQLFFLRFFKDFFLTSVPNRSERLFAVHMFPVLKRFH